MKSFVLDFPTHWLAYHILGADQNMARQIIVIQSGMDASTAYDTKEKYCMPPWW